MAHNIGKMPSAPTDSADASHYSLRSSHLPGLDGLRAFAVLGVVLYHFGFHWLSGGYLGVDLFFVLSGFLITSLLIEEHLANGSISMLSFWGRRLRRLLPALLTMLVVVVIGVGLINRYRLLHNVIVDIHQLRSDAIATIFYVANWHLIFEHQSYFAQFAVPSPLQHTWSLAIEEQYYLLFPFAAMGLVLWSGRRHHGRTGSITVLLVVAAASALEMALLFHPGSDPSRVYYGTDTRAFDLLIGAALGVATADRGVRSARLGSWIDKLAWPAVILLGYFWVSAGTNSFEPRSFMYRGGFLLCSLLAAVVIAAAAFRPASLLTRLLSLRWLVAIGLVSYGIYLWHWPIVVLFNPTSLGMNSFLTDLVRCVLIASFTLLSYFFIERPIRRTTFRAKQVALLLPSSLAVAVVLALVATSSGFSTPKSTQHITVVKSTSLPGVGGFSSQQPIRLTHPITPSDPLRVTLIGDSVLQYSSQGLSAMFTATGEAQMSSLAIEGFNLGTMSETTRQNWITSVRATTPDLVVGTWQWDDGMALMHPQAFQALLDQTVNALLAQPGGAQGILFLQFPPWGPRPATIVDQQGETINQDAGLAAMNKAELTEVSLHPGKVMYLPLAPSVLDSKGNFTWWLPVRTGPTSVSYERVRWTDGTHLCPAGVIRYGSALMADLTQLFGISPPQPSWQTESWLTNPTTEFGWTYCPADGPKTHT